MAAREIRLDEDEARSDPVRPAIKALDRGQVIGFPTESVLGLGVRPDDAVAQARLNAAKGRAEDQPLTHHFASVDAAEARTGPWSPLVHRLFGRFAPGPLTVLLPDPRTAEHTIGVRVPDHPVFRLVARAAGGCVAGSSANATTEPPATNWDEVPSSLRDALAVIVVGGPDPAGTASTILRPARDHVDVIRAGALSAERLGAVAGPVTLFVCTGNTCRSPMARALLRDALRRRTTPERPLPDVWSAGTGAVAGYPASRHAVAAMRERGLDLESHLSSPLTPTAIVAADFIACMTESAARLIVEHVPEVADRVEVIDEDAGGVPDPFGGALPVYRRCADVLADWIDAFVERHLDRFSP